ncbi:restriction endonuclease subunit S [Roseburia intestinalis]|uniref:restriction endonuclease subunit S n=1 Tax=Roseburia intestinalis TaxID=166486 RepID=UPI00156DB987|nr:restriction endonuclease subunit S [Roseburia intestinalis]NSC33415.1 restriction endonuclease subunit S [Roseburia intestinalis]
MPYEKVGKNEPVCIADEVPFEIPESWEWVRLGNIFQHNTGKALNASNRTGSLLPYITTSNLYWDRFELGNLREMYFSENEIEKCTATKGDLLVCEGGDIGRAAIWMFDEDIRIQNHIHKLRSYTEVCTEFFYYLFYLYKHAGWIGGKGIGIQGLSANALHALLFPLPPLSEQKRIVSKIKESEPLMEKYADVEKYLDKLNTEFPDQLRKSILQEAVQGKLVPQDPTDEPVSVLLERIRAEKQHLVKEGKIKKDKHESVIFRRDNSHYEKRGSEEVCIDDEIPFEIPENWCWARMGSYLDVRDGTHDTPKYVLEGIPLVTSKNLCNGKIDFSTAKFISREDHLAISLRSKVDAGDIMYAMIGSIGNPVLYNGNAEFSIKNMALFKKIANGLDMEYVYWFLYLSQDTMKKFASGGVQSFVSLGYLRNYWIPVPPIQEQHRIVTAIKQILPKISTL